jgi:hypothetical protein
MAACGEMGMGFFEKKRVSVFLRNIIHRLREKASAKHHPFRLFFRPGSESCAFAFPTGRAIVTKGHLHPLGRMVFQRTGKKADAGRVECGYLRT